MTIKAIAAIFMFISFGSMASEKDHDMSSMKGEGEHVNHVTSGNVGSPRVKSDISRTLDITMDDTMRFAPEMIAVKQGETVRFSIKNHGKITHEFVLGSPAELKEHAGMMQRHGMEMEHDMPNMISLAPGKESDVIWTFGQTGTLSFACLVPGHMEAGMVGEVIVQ